MNGKYTVIDTETTGLTPVAKNGGQYGYLTEIGAVKVKDDKVIERFQTFIKPPIPIPEEITKITGISDETVKGAPTYQAAIKSLYDWIDKESTLIFHNSPFDLRFLNFYGREMNINFDNFPCIDTMELSKRTFNESELKKTEEELGLLTKTGKVSYKLETLCKVVDIPDPSHHRADNDAEVTWKLFEYLMANGGEKEVEQIALSHFNEPKTADWLKKSRIIKESLWPKDKPFRLYVKIVGNDRQYGEIFYDFRSESWQTKQAPYVIRNYNSIERELLEKYNCDIMNVKYFQV